VSAEAAKALQDGLAELTAAAADLGIEPEEKATEPEEKAAEPEGVEAKAIRAVAGSLEERLRAVSEAVRNAWPTDDHWAFPVATLDGSVVVEHSIYTFVTDDQGNRVTDEYGDPEVASRESYTAQHSYAVGPDGEITVSTKGTPVDLVQVVVGKGHGEPIRGIVEEIAEGFDPSDEAVAAVKSALQGKAGSFVLSKTNHARALAAKTAIDAILEDYTAKHGSEDPADGEATKAEGEPETPAPVDVEEKDAEPEPTPEPEAEPVEEKEHEADAPVLVAVDQSALDELAAFAKALVP
jgi:hypothetical protein